MEGVVHGTEEVCANSCACIWTGLGQVPHLWLGDRLVSEPTLASWDGGCGGSGGGGGGPAGWGLGRCRALTRADRTAKCQRVSLSLLLCLMRSPLSHLVASCLDIFLTIYHRTGPQRRVSQAHRHIMSEFTSFFCSDWGFYFLIFFRHSSEH